MSQDQKMEDLFEKLADALLDRVKSKEASSADLNVVRQFLKDNNITSNSPKHPKLKELTEGLPFDDSGEPAALN